MSESIMRVAPFRPQRLLLVASLALNLFFVGAAIAIAVRHNGPPPGNRNPASRIDRLAATLPPADAKLLYAQFDAAAPAFAAERDAAREAHEAVRLALMAVPFDPATADAALSRLREARRALWRTLHGVTVQAAAQMSAEGRMRLADQVPSGEGHGNAPPPPR